MTQKELLYMEDAISHETIICNILDEMLCNLEDEDLLKFVNTELKRHTSLKDKLLKKMEGEINE